MLEKIVEFTPAFDKRNSDPHKDYGIHGVDLRMILKGDKGAVQFILYTNWHLPHIQEEIYNKLDGKSAFEIKTFLEPLPADLGYYSPYPQYEGQQCITKHCELLDGKPCYYDGSILQAKKIYETLLKEGSNGVWRELERRYNVLFGND